MVHRVWRARLAHLGEERVVAQVARDTTLAAGRTAPGELAALAQPRLQAPREELEAALEGRRRHSPRGTG
jgi:hypothetical protein